VSDIDRGVNRHLWETRAASLEEDFALDPVSPLHDLLDLVREVLVARGYEEIAGEEDPEIVATLRRAEELVELEEGGAEVRHDDAQQASAELWSLFRTVVSDPESDAGAEARLHRGAGYGQEPGEDGDGVELGLHLERTDALTEADVRAADGAPLGGPGSD
jgi:hypothetical protein